MNRFVGGPLHGQISTDKYAETFWYAKDGSFERVAKYKKISEGVWRFQGYWNLKTGQMCEREV